MSIFIKGTDCDGCPGCTDDPCAPAPDAPAPTLVCRTASASLTKCGYDEYGTPSSPPKVYRTRSLSGSVTAKYYDDADSECVTCIEKYVWTFFGDCTFARSTCSETNTGQVEKKFYSDCSNLTSTSTCVRCEVPSNTDCAFDLGACLIDTTNTSTTTRDYVGSDTCCDGTTFYAQATGTATETLSNEYTTAHLESDVSAALPSFSGSFTNGNCTGAYYDVSSDELTITKRKMEYKFTLPTLAGFGCYKITWNEHFVPEGGGAATDTAKSYQWDGVATETGVYTINVPANQGTTTITDIVATCDCA